MPLRWNGSVLGSRRDPEAAAFSGVWGLRDQALYQRDAFWTPTFNGKPWFYEQSFNSVGLAASAAAITVTASATPHTKGSWTEIIASTSTQVTLLSFVISNVASTNIDTAMLIDVGIGASGSETAIIENVAVGGAIAVGTGAGVLLFQCPINIPSGSRISVRNQATIASDTVQIFQVSLFNIGNQALVPDLVDVLGTSTTTSQGTAFSGNSGSWNEIVASTSQDYIGFSLVPSVVGATVSAATTNTFTLGFGAAGSEQEIGAISVRYGTGETVHSVSHVCFFAKEVPQGSRIAVKHDIASNPAQRGVTVIAVPKP
jgi:hypothetical protein